MINIDFQAKLGFGPLALTPPLDARRVSLLHSPYDNNRRLARLHLCLELNPVADCLEAPLQLFS